MQQEQRGEAEEREPVWYFQQYAKIYLQLHTHTPYEEVEEEKEKEKKNSKFQQWQNCPNQNNNSTDIRQQHSLEVVFEADGL